MERKNDPTPGSFGSAAANERNEVPVGTVVVPLADVVPSDIADSSESHADPEHRNHERSRPARAESAERIWHWTVVVEGTCMRSTTTAFDRRRDALLSATRFVEAAKRIVRSEPGHVNGTIAHAIRQDGLPNGSDGRFLLHLELRDADPASIGRVYDRIAAEAWTIGRLSQTKFSLTPHETNPSVVYDVRSQTVSVPGPAVHRTPTPLPADGLPDQALRIG